MRRQTQWALGGVLAGTMMLGVTGTLAVFSDTESVSATVGAGSLTMDVSAQPERGQRLELVSNPQTTLGLHVAVTGGAGTLSLSIDGTVGDCAGLPPAILTVAVDGTETSRHLCELIGRPLPLTELADGRSDTVLTLRVARDPAVPAGRRANPTTSTLRLTVAQPEGGFSDTATVDVVVRTPPGGATNGNAPG